MWIQHIFKNTPSKNRNSAWIPIVDCETAEMEFLWRVYTCSEHEIRSSVISEQIGQLIAASSQTGSPQPVSLDRLTNRRPAGGKLEGKSSDLLKSSKVPE